MAEIEKLSVEKTLGKIRRDDETRSKSEKRAEEISALDEEIKRMRALRQKLERPKR